MVCDLLIGSYSLGQAMGSQIGKKNLRPFLLWTLIIYLWWQNPSISHFSKGFDLSRTICTEKKLAHWGVFNAMHNKICLISIFLVSLPSPLLDLTHSSLLFYSGNKNRWGARDFVLSKVNERWRVGYLSASPSYFHPMVG